MISAPYPLSFGNRDKVFSCLIPGGECAPNRTTKVSPLQINVLDSLPYSGSGRPSASILTQFLFLCV